MLLQYDTNEMKELLRSFHTLTGMRIVVFDSDFRKIAEHPNYDCDFCTIVRSDPLAQESCHASDRYACKRCSEQNSIYSYTCHAGLTETVAPINYRNVVIGYIMFGQVLRHNDMDSYWSAVLKNCSGYDINLDKLKQAYCMKIPVSLEQVHASAKILETCASYLWLKRYISLQEDSLPNQIDEYISANLDADLSAAALCKRFKISRSRLYKIASEYYGKGIEQLTRTLRIGAAIKLLEETDLTVSNLSQQVGYADYNYFIKVFKKETGFTPYQYRKQFSFLKGTTEF